METVGAWKYATQQDASTPYLELVSRFVLHGILSGDEKTNQLKV